MKRKESYVSLEMETQKTERRSKAVRKPRVGGCHKCPEMVPHPHILLPSWLAPARWGKQAEEGKCPGCSEL